MSFDNPFSESRLNTSRNFRPEWDIPELNQQFTKTLVRQVQRLRGRKEPDPAQMIIAMTGPPGYGKTHLFGRVEHEIGQEVFFVFVPVFEVETMPLDHIRWHVIESLFDPSPGPNSPLDTALARICRPALETYFSELEPTLAARHETIRRRLQESPEAVIEIVRQVKTIQPFLHLADSLVHILPGDAGVVRALALGWAPSQFSMTVKRWLQGQDLPDADRAALGLAEQAPSALQVLRAIPALFAHDRPMLICCDQVEGLLQSESPPIINRFTTALMDLLQAVPAQIILSCFHDQFKKFLDSAFPAFKMRVKQPFFQLEVMNSEQAIRLVRGRIQSWSGRDPSRPPSWPFTELCIQHLVREHTPTPRALIQKCDSDFGSWLEEGATTEICVKVGNDPVDPSALFLQEWKREIEQIRLDPKRAPSYLHQDRLYRGVLEALKLAQSAQRLRDFGGVRVLDVTDKAIKSTPAAQRLGAKVTLASKPGGASPTVIVALSTAESANNLRHFFNALFAARTDEIAGALFIHPKRNLALGDKTETAFHAAIRSGRLRVMPLEDYPDSYHATECLTAMIDRANQRELVLNGITQSAEDCRDLVIKTGVIDNLDLFKMFGQWKPPATLSNESKPTVPTGQNAIDDTPTPVPTSDKPVQRNSDEALARTSNSTDGPPPVDFPQTTLDQWATKMLDGAVKKLKLLGQQVEPDGFEVGPTFARLRVKTLGKTSFKAVSNKAVDLRISLGLEVVPIVGSQAGCISIDIQRPDRAFVSLNESLANTPIELEGKPAFPVGQDVTGQSHWLNLADPSDCHLLIAGTTGSGKSEFLRSIIASLAARLEPDQVQFVLIDPKRVTFNIRGTSPYLRSPIAYSLDSALPIIENCMNEMDRRYSLLAERKLSNISELPADLLPRIVIIIDEFASFLEDKESKKVVSSLLKRIGAMARAAGIHLVISTQRPDKDVVTPLLRENLPGRIALRVTSKAGSDLILDAPDAENLLGKGDLIWKSGGERLRLQSPFVPQPELEKLLRCRI